MVKDPQTTLVRLVLVQDPQVGEVDVRLRRVATFFDQALRREDEELTEVKVILAHDPTLTDSEYRFFSTFVDKMKIPNVPAKT